jgi:hypothetical protein
MDHKIINTWWPNELGRMEEERSGAASLAPDKRRESAQQIKRRTEET